MTINECVKKWSDVAFSDDSDLGLERILSLCLIDFTKAGPDAGQAAIEIGRDCCLNIGTELDYDNTRAASIIQRAINRAVAEREAEIERLRTACEKVIKMNLQHAEDQYGDRNKAESWSCVSVLRAALADAEGEEDNHATQTDYDDDVIDVGAGD